MTAEVVQSKSLTVPDGLEIRNHTKYGPSLFATRDFAPGDKLARIKPDLLLPTRKARQKSRDRLYIEGFGAILQATRNAKLQQQLTMASDLLDLYPVEGFPLVFRGVKETRHILVNAVSVMVAYASKVMTLQEEGRLDEKEAFIQTMKQLATTHFSARSRLGEHRRVCERYAEILCREILDHRCPGLITPEVLSHVASTAETHAVLVDKSLHGLYALTSYIRHGCSGNVSSRMVGRDLELLALLPIRSGEPILDTYFVKGNHQRYFWPAYLRRRTLLRAFGFLCECRFCSFPDLLRERPCPSADCKHGFMTVLHAKPCAEKHDYADWEQWTTVEGHASDVWNCNSCKLSLSSGEAAKNASIGLAVEDQLVTRFITYTRRVTHAPLFFGKIEELYDSLLRNLGPQHWTTRLLALDLAVHKKKALQGAMELLLRGIHRREARPAPMRRGFHSATLAALSPVAMHGH